MADAAILYRIQDKWRLFFPESALQSHMLSCVRSYSACLIWVLRLRIGHMDKVS